MWHESDENSQHEKWTRAEAASFFLCFCETNAHIAFFVLLNTLFDSRIWKEVLHFIQYAHWFDNDHLIPKFISRWALLGVRQKTGQLFSGPAPMWDNFFPVSFSAVSFYPGFDHNDAFGHVHRQHRTIWVNVSCSKNHPNHATSEISFAKVLFILFDRRRCL